jgi:hypothetical protein
MLPRDRPGYPGMSVVVDLTKMFVLEFLGMLGWLVEQASMIVEDICT